MTHALEFIAEIKNGWIVPEKNIGSFLKHCEGRQARIILSWGLKKRTLKQNSYYKGVVLPHFVAFMKEAGVNIAPDVADQCLKRWVNFTREETMPDGTSEKVQRSTTELDTKAMAEFTEEVIAYVAKRFGLFIPPPGGDVNDHFQNR